MRVPPVARSLRIAGSSVAPGESRVLTLPLPGKARATGAEDAIPVHVTVGRRAGPRITVLAASRGFEASTTQAALGFAAEMAAAEIDGSVVVVPVFRPGGRFAAGGTPVRTHALWRFPGDVGGTRREREAFSLFSETCVGATAVVLLSAPLPGRTALAHVRGDLEDPRFRRLALHAGMPAMVHAKAAPGSLAAAARETSNTLVELVAPSSGADASSVTTLLGALRQLANALGSTPSAEHDRRPPKRPVTFSRTTLLRAPTGGLLESSARPGQGFKKKQILAQLVPVLSEREVTLACPRDAVLLESPQPGTQAIRKGATLFRLAIGSRLTRAKISAAPHVEDKHDGAQAEAMPDTKDNQVSLSDAHIKTPGKVEELSSPANLPSRARPQPLVLGWVERVSLPLLGLMRVKAKIDTGARTSALHVSQMKTVATTGGPHARPILEITIPGSGKTAVVVRAPVREYVQVKDTSGRTERRPVIETTLRLGNLERRIRVTLTDRGDMLFPLLIGRTSLGAGIVVDPARRNLLPRAKTTQAKPTTKPSRTKPTTTGTHMRPLSPRAKVNES